jgi:hypothetical protein
MAPMLGMALLASCGGGDGPTGGGGEKITSEASRAASASIGIAGGTVTATGSNGVRYTLVVLPGALAQATRITMTPVSAHQGLPLSGGFAAGVQLEPAGLHFARAVRLAVTHLPAAPSGTRLAGVTFEGDGDSLGLAPLADSAGTAIAFITHFSGASFGFGTTADVQQLANAVTTGVASQPFLNQLAALNFPSPPGNPTALLILEQWFGTVVLPELQGAGTDAELLLAVSDYDDWATGAVIYLRGVFPLVPGPAVIAQPSVPSSLSTEVSQASQAAAVALRNAVLGNNVTCRTQHGVQALLNVVFWQAYATYFGVDNTAEQLDRATVLNNLCARVIEVSHSLANPLPVGSAHTLDVTFGLQFSDGTEATGALFEVSVTGTGATIQNPAGFTDSSATWGGSVITAQSASVTLSAQACLLEPGTTTVTPVCGTANILGAVPLHFTFDNDLEGWTSSSNGNPAVVRTPPWGHAIHTDIQGNGVAELDGQDPAAGDTVANGSISRSIAIPSTATTLRFDVSAHNRDGSSGHLKVRIAGSVVLDEVIVNPGDLNFHFETKTVDISTFASRAVTIVFEQHDNGNPGGSYPGNDKQLLIDNIEIGP